MTKQELKADLTSNLKTTPLTITVAEIVFAYEVSSHVATAAIQEMVNDGFLTAERGYQGLNRYSVA